MFFSGLSAFCLGEVRKHFQRSVYCAYQTLKSIRAERLKMGGPVLFAL